MLKKKDFKKLINQKKIRNLLIKTYNENKLFNNLYFVGNEGSGNLTISLILVSKLLKIKNQTYNHPDIHFLFPTTKDKKYEFYIKKWHKFITTNQYGSLQDWINIAKIKKNMYIGVSQINRLIKTIYLKSFQKNKKVILIWMPDKFNKTASSKILKILEEPPKNTIFIFSGDKTNNILPAILSRLQIIYLESLNKEIIQKNIIKLFNIEKKNAEKISQLSNGNWNKVLKIITNKNKNILKNYFLSILIKSIMAHKNKQILNDFIKFSEDISQLQQEHQIQFITYSISKFKEIIFFKKKIINSTNLQNYIKKDLWDFFIKIIDDKKIYHIINILEKSYISIINNINIKIVFLELLIKITKYIHQNNK